MLQCRLDAELRYRCPKKFHHRPFQDWRLGNLNSHGLLISFVETATIWGMGYHSCHFGPSWTIPTIGCVQAERWVEEFLEGSRMIWMERICSFRICHLQLVAFARCMTSRPRGRACALPFTAPNRGSGWFLDVQKLQLHDSTWSHFQSSLHALPICRSVWHEHPGCMSRETERCCGISSWDRHPVELGYSWDWLDCWRLIFSAAILSQGLLDSHQTEDYSPCGASPRPGQSPGRSWEHGSQW